tara:strand:- start:5881 stop:6324 length:444 start_codon:yes stop_codon:yes gene_type:complete
MARIAPMTPIYQRGQTRPRAMPSAPNQRKPRKRDKEHLAAVSLLPCAVPGCGREPVHVAHLRYADANEGASLCGKGQKPDDWRVLPLCPEHHMHGPQAQHAMNERSFWAMHCIEPYALARALYGLSGQHDKMRFLIEHATLIFPQRD